MSFITSPGLVGFSNQINQTAPNLPTTVSYFAATGASANADVSIVPKGTGSLLGAIPDNLITGGNKRGVGAVDWQLLRTVNDQVAAAQYSTISGGQQNKIVAGASWATIAGGFGNIINSAQGFIGGGGAHTISGANAAIAGGSTNTASNTSAGILAGSNNTASGTRAAVVAGLNNLASGDDSTAMGQNATTRGIAGTVAMSCKTVGGTLGDTQEAIYQGFALTGNAAATVLTSNGGAADATNTMTLKTNMAQKFLVDVVGLDTATGDTLCVKFEGIILEKANPATTAVLAMVTTPVFASAGAATWTINATANVGRGGLDITVTGAVGVNIRWSYTGKCKEVSS